MSGYSATMRMEREQKVKVKVCGDCGIEITDSEILCQDCTVTLEIKQHPADRWVPFMRRCQADIQSGESQ